MRLDIPVGDRVEHALIADHDPAVAGVNDPADAELPHRLVHGRL
jgi:hypothetical protein